MVKLVKSILFYMFGYLVMFFIPLVVGIGTMYYLLKEIKMSFKNWLTYKETIQVYKNLTKVKDIVVPKRMLDDCINSKGDINIQYKLVDYVELKLPEIKGYTNFMIFHGRNHPEEIAELILSYDKNMEIWINGIKVKNINIPERLFELDNFFDVEEAVIEYIKKSFPIVKNSRKYIYNFSQDKPFIDFLDDKLRGIKYE